MHIIAPVGENNGYTLDSCRVQLIIDWDSVRQWQIVSNPSRTKYSTIIRYKQDCGELHFDHS